MSYTESSLKALTVVKLKEILANHSLPVTGKKDDLISRILESNLTSSTTEEQPQEGEAKKSGEDSTTLDPTGQSTDEPDGEGVGSTQELATAPTTSTEGVTPQSQQEGVEDQERKEQEKLEKLKLEEEKRQKRLARFGGGGAANSNSKDSQNGNEVEEAKKKRAERFGIPVDQEKDQQQKLNKSLELLDKPLGSNKRERKPKSEKPSSSSTTTTTSKSNPSNEQTIASKIGDSKAIAEPAAALAAQDPELQKRLAEDEEKKKKRAARFGAPPSGASEPQEKKTKTD